MAHTKTAFILFLSALIASSFASAQDPGTYRPGQPYSVAPAKDASICSSQCQGDAACRGWNFVRTNPRQKNGICEFNSIAVDPIQSQVSISANLTYVSNPTGQSRIIPAGVRTTRIGSPAPQITKKNPAPTQHTAQRKIVRQAVPNPVQAQPAHFRHNLGVAQTRRVAPQTNRAPHADVNPAHIRRTHNGLPPRAPIAQNPQAALQASPQRTAQPVGADQRLQQHYQNIQSQQHTPKAQASHPQNIPQQATTARRGSLIGALTRSGPTPAHARPVAQARPIATSQAAAPPVAAQPITGPNLAPQSFERSLYGHLNDDVSIPRPLTLADVNIPEDEPIPTAASVPVIPVERSSFGGLAGG